MATSFNRVILLGNLTRDVELKYTQGGTAVTEVGLAVNDRRKTQSGEWVEETTFVDVTMWGRTAEVASEYLSKGSSILVEGRLKLDTWETDGQKRSKLRVVAERMQMVGGRPGSGGGGGGGAARSSSGGGASSGGPSSRDNFDESEYSQSAAVGQGGDHAGGGESHGGPGDDDIPF
jgi:single-strand DNA-binding protein